MPEHDVKTVELRCPCCGASLTIDLALGKVIAQQPPPPHTKPPDLDEATQLLQKRAARREAAFQKSAEEERTKSQLLERKFEEALKKTQGEPITPPTRDIDLD